MTASGPARIAFVGEAWGAEERAESAKAGRPRPFVGASGRLFNAFLGTIGIVRSKDEPDPPGVLITNVFNLQPPKNEVERLFVPAKDGDRSRPPFAKGRYANPALGGELERLEAELRAFRPSVIVALGNTPLWALCGVTGILSRRGCLHHWRPGRFLRPIPVIPAIHPAFVLRKFVWFPLVVSDLRRAVGVGEGRIGVERLGGAARMRPTLEDVRAALRWRGPITFDIETMPALRAITCVGLGDEETGASVCIPFVDWDAPGRSYWREPEDEVEAWEVLAQVLSRPDTTKIAQVASYDVTWLREVAGISVQGPLWDTRTMHHALWPELPHALENIATTWPDVLFPPWKAEHRAGKDEG